MLGKYCSKIINGNLKAFDIDIDILDQPKKEQVS